MLKKTLIFLIHYIFIFYFLVTNKKGKRSNIEDILVLFSWHIIIKRRELIYGHDLHGIILISFDWTL